MIDLNTIDSINLNNEELEPALISLKDDLQSAIMAYLQLENGMEELGDPLSLSFLHRFIESASDDELPVKLEQCFLKGYIDKTIILLMALLSKTEKLIDALSVRRDGDTSIDEEKLIEIFSDFKETLEKVSVLTWDRPDYYVALP